MHIIISYLKYINRLLPDSHTLATLLYRSWTVLAGGATVILIPLFLNSVEQGYFYTFSSILALQVFFELGMGQVVIQIVAHEAAHLKQRTSGLYEGPRNKIARLEQFKNLLRKWYLISSVLLLFIVASTGIIFFRSSELAWDQWLYPWCILVFATSINLLLSGKLAIMEGFGRVHEVNRLRLAQSFLGYSLMWITLLNGGGLWVIAIVPITASLITTWWLTTPTVSRVLSISSSSPCSEPILWLRDVFPFQWRIAISWISGYFLSGLFTPMIFNSQGAVEAGRLGLALSIFSAISTIGMSWISAKIPIFSMLVARRESATLLRIFSSVAFRSVITTSGIAFIVLFCAFFALLYGVPLMERVPSMTVLICLTLISITNSCIFASAAFIRAHKEEPLLIMSITSGLITALAVWLTAPYGTIIMILSYMAVTILIALPWTLMILRKYIERHKSYIHSTQI